MKFVLVVAILNFTFLCISTTKLGIKSFEELEAEVKAFEQIVKVKILNEFQDFKNECL